MLKNQIFQGTANLLLLTLIFIAVTVIIIGHERKHEKDYIHPWFGRYTVNIPNLMSYVRFPLGLWMVCVYFFSFLHTHIWHFTFHLSFALVCLFDFLDGKFARKWNAITEGGKSLDPAADKWVTFCLAIIAYLYGKFPWWAVVIIFLREIVSIIQRARLKRRGEDVSARWLGKIKTGVQFTVLYIYLLRTDTLPGTILLDKIAQLFPPALMLWGTILLCFCTVISIFPFFKSFSYVNEYEKLPQRKRGPAQYILGIPNILTVGNYLCGVTAVFCAMPGIKINYRSFVILFWIFAAGVCDAADGPLARKLKSYSDFGACIDSSSDLSTFGLAAAVTIFLRFQNINLAASLLGFIVASFYFIFVHLRLARFTMLQKDKDKTKKDDFVGLPSPAGAVVSMMLFTLFDNIYIIAIGIIIISLLMYSKFNFVSHSNAFKHRLYKFFLIPLISVGFFMLLILIFQQPFVSTHFSRELIVYFKTSSWLLSISFVIYIIDGIWRTCST
ncbi:MAG: CDP-alcohol phosphatidyltransferase family protein [bacterium]